MLVRCLQEDKQLYLIEFLACMHRNPVVVVQAEGAEDVRSGPQDLWDGCTPPRGTRTTSHHFWLVEGEHVVEGCAQHTRVSGHVLKHRMGNCVADHELRHSCGEHNCDGEVGEPCTSLQEAHTVRAQHTSAHAAPHRMPICTD